MQIGVKIRINFHAAAVQRIDFQLIFTLMQIRVKIRINFHAAALQRINQFSINFHANADSGEKSELIFPPPRFSELIFN